MQPEQTVRETPEAAAGVPEMRQGRAALTPGIAHVLALSITIGVMTVLAIILDMLFNYLVSR